MSKKDAAPLKAPRGCPDWLPEQAELADWIEEQAKKTASLFNFKPYRTPLFESSEVFTKTLGDASDIVTKEMYSFTDRNGESFTLRPEGTAPLVRLFLSNKLQRELPLKIFYSGPMFRYERPQKGRQRQFHQIGVEYLGAPNSLLAHFEVISLASLWLKSLNIKSKISLHINAIGSFEERQEYKKALIAYLEPISSKLSEESQKRLETNPLRILDSKSEQDKLILKEAPLVIDFIEKSKKEELDKLIEKLNSYDINTKLDPLLVRGLDYYNDLVFEFKAESDLGAQNTVLAGGRYDNLVESMGGKPTPSIGWAAGLERLMLLSEKKDFKSTRAGVLMQNPDDELAISISQKLRENGIEAFVPHGGNFSKRMQKIQKQGCNFAVIYGDDEIQSNKWSVKNLDSGEQSLFSIEEALNYIKSF